MIFSILDYGGYQIYNAIFIMHIRKVQARNRINQISQVIPLQKIIDATLRILLDKINHAL